LKAAENILGFATGLTVYVAALAAALAQTNAASSFVEIPIKTRNGDLLVEARINHSEPLWFKLDTGFGITMLNPSRVEPLRLERVGKMTIVGIAGEEEAATYRGAVFDFGGLSYEPRRVAVLPSEAGRRWRKRDGILGAGFFRRFVVEIDADKERVRLFEPGPFTYTGSGEILPLEFKQDTPIVEATLVPPGADPIQGRFEIDTGCDDCVCLGHDFVAAHRLLESRNASDTRRGIGGSAEIRPGLLAELRLGKLVVKNPSANFFVEGSPAGDGQAGHIGLGALQRFRMIFDYSRRRLILEEK
jgi:hypothetical protein